jgi:cytochrome c oxidase subunit 4
MEQAKEKELTTLNLILMALAVVSLAVAGWTVAADGFRAGTDDLFLILVCLLLALLFAINPLIWAYNKGYFDSFMISDEGAAAGDVAAAEAHGVEHEHAHGGSNRQNVIVWGGLLALTGVEVFLAYIHIPPLAMLIVLMLLSIMKAALIVAYFMHLKFERISLVLMIVPTLVVLLSLFAILFPDSFRVRHLGPPPSQSEQAEHEK